MSEQKKILVVDDDVNDLRFMKEQVVKYGHICLATNSAEKALELVTSEYPDIVITDQKMPEKDGLTILREVKEFDSNIIVIILTAYGTFNAVLDALRSGAFDYLEKPFLPEQFEVALRRAISHKNLSDENVNLRTQVEKNYHFENIIGKSEPLRKLLEEVARASRSNAHVMIYGESGTGKELIARSIHANSPRTDKAFVPVDCVALPQNLLETELFGHEKGAFTGADAMRRGLLEYAHQGSLFLDEICELDLNLQAKLLRVIQEKEFRRIGSSHLIKTDVRIISATNKKPDLAIKTGILREDLYYRLNVVPLEVPPLRERKDDIPVLINYFIDKICRANQMAKKEMDPEAIEVLMEYPWPGNIRELQNLMEQLISMLDGKKIKVSNLPEKFLNPKMDREQIKKAGTNGLPFSDAKKVTLENFEREYFTKLLKNCQGNISKAAEKAQVSRPTIYRIIKIHDLHKLN
jgi:DNA-binding NtrC family response regulator